MHSQRYIYPVGSSKNNALPPGTLGISREVALSYNLLIIRKIYILFKKVPLFPYHLVIRWFQPFIAYIRKHPGTGGMLLRPRKICCPVLNRKNGISNLPRYAHKRVIRGVVRSKVRNPKHCRSTGKSRQRGLSGHLNGSSEMGFAMRARGRTRYTHLSWLQKITTAVDKKISAKRR